ncbi:MAG: DUF6468 domain-containing protein [Pseudomonadota bacterium]
MTIITDGLLIATCLTAALYCIVLSRRLAKFADTKSGIGQQISQLNSILEETRTTIKESRAGAKSVSERLSRDLAGAKKASQDLATLIEQAEGALDRAIELHDTDRGPQKARPDPVRDPVTNVKSDPESPASPPRAENSSPIEELPADDIASRDFDMADARGEPQLGFLPSVSDASMDAELPVDIDPAIDADESPSEDLSTANSENLLKVERMAL